MPELVPFQPRPGYQPLLQPTPGGLEFIHFGVACIPEMQVEMWYRPQHETVLVLLSGEIEFRARHACWPASRFSVFEEPATALFVPPGHRIEIVASTDAEVAIASAPSKQSGLVRFYGPDTAVSRTVGRDNWERQVTMLVGADVPAESLIVGETLNPPGHWSSYPPHRHDFDRPDEEANMEETYFYRMHPKNGFALQRVYTEDQRFDRTLTVRDNTALPIVEGFHPVVAAGGHELYYLWVLAGRQRQLLPYTDPAFAHLLG